MDKVQQPVADPNQVSALINSVKWYHRFEVLPGVFTPGSCEEDLKAIFAGLRVPEDLSGQTVVEIGTWDGSYAFELEARGAHVIATDIQNPDKTGFNVARRLRNSHVQYIRTSVYELSRHIVEPVDLVLFKGVLYHLKNPIQAIDEIARVLKPSGRVHFETEYFSHYAETTERFPVANWLLMAVFAHSNIPMTLAYSGRYKGFVNWFVPNAACLKGWFQQAGLDVEWMDGTPRIVTQQPGRKWRYLLDLVRHVQPRSGSWDQRAWGVAVKARAEPRLEHHVVGEKAVGRSG